MNALGGIRNGAIERRPSGAQPESRDHHAGVAEDHLRLNQALAFDAADQAIGVNVDIVKRQRGRVAQTDTVLVLRLVVREALGACVDNEPGGPGGRVGQNRVVVGDAAVRDPLLAAVDLVADDLAIFLDAVGGGLQRAQVAAGFRLGCAVGEENALVGDPAQPLLLLLGSGAEGDRIAAQERGEKRGGDAEIDARHLFADEIDVEGAAAHAAVLFGNEQELDAELVRVAHVANNFHRTFVALIQSDQLFVGQALLGEVPQRFQAELQCLLGDHV